MVYAKVDNIQLDITISPKLKAEGEARELVRQIQQLRKEADCKLDEEVTVILPSWPKDFEEIIKKETLAKNILKGPKLEIKRG